MCTEDSIDVIRLVSTANHQVSGPYLTLSHCWGSSLPLCLLRSNVQDFYSGIPLTALPKTFRDAVMASRRLGARYLWIDSLCIFQDKDDLSDWYREASLMDKVYSHSRCNISASAAIDSSGGLFRSRNPRSLCSGYIDLNKSLGLSPSGPVPYSVIGCDFWEVNVLKSPVNKRGWVFQERHLSPRVLYFGRTQLLWECRESTAAESFPSGLPECILANKERKDIRCSTIKPARYETSAKKSLINSPWIKIVQSYSGTHLTHQSDKLVALSGVAKQFVSLIHDEYVAGLWRNQLPHYLCWRTRRDPATSPNPPPQYLAPTWSWASVNREVIWMDPHFSRTFLTVEDVRLNYATEDITGAVTGGYLDVKGHLWTVQCRDTGALSWSASFWGPDRNFPVRGDGIPLLSVGT